MDFPFTCAIEPFLSTDGYDLTYGTSISTECNYFETEDTDDEGSNANVSAWLALPPETTISQNSRVTLPDGTQPPIKKISKIRRLSDNEIEYIRVILGVLSERGGI